MAIPVFPTDIQPRFLTDGFGYSFADGRLKTQMDAGVPKVRRRFSSSGRPVSAQISGPQDTMARFERFWSETCIGGSIPFLMPDFLTNGASLVDQDGNSLTDDNGNSLVVSSYWLVMFGDSAPQQSAVSANRFRVAFSFVILP